MSLETDLSFLFQYGHQLVSSGCGFNGCYASHIVLESGTAVYRIPSDLSDLVVVPINCALATMVNAVSCIPQNNTPGSASTRTALIQVNN